MALLQRIVRTWATTCRSASSVAAPGKAKYNLESKVALVTASTDGIGFAIAKRLAESGATVVISSRKQANVDRALKQLHDQGLSSVVGQVCHVGKAADRDHLVRFVAEQYNGVDILVSNAAINPTMGPILDTEETVFDKIFEVNVKAAFLLTQSLYEHMARRPGDKSIVYVSSFAGYQIESLLSAYSVSKTALIGLSRAVALHCADAGIRVNCVCPGVIQTRFSEQLWKNESVNEEMLKMTIQKRIGQPDEIANLVTFLASEEASYTTGESYVAAGGIYSRL